MLSTIEIETKLLEIKPVLTDKFHVSKIGYFGSYASGKQTANSDLDLVVEFSQPIGWSFFTLEEFLEKSLNLKIDLVTKNALKNELGVLYLIKLNTFESERKISFALAPSVHQSSRQIHCPRKGI